MRIFGVIMAGGGGTRFWPLSRKQTPKQLLNLTGKEVMINEAIDRLSKVADQQDIFIVTNSTQVEKMAEVTKDRINRDHILVEPAARNTAACIGYAAVEILKRYGDGIMVITPSDAYIRDGEELARVLKTAIKAAEQPRNQLVTIGITPTFPATGFGYIKFTKNANDVKRVIKFVEKPDAATAQTYLNDGNYVWNSGMFVWKVSSILKRFEEQLPDIYKELMLIYDKIGTEEESDMIRNVYPSIRSISIDYGIMEKAKHILVVPAEFGWNDVGSWDMLGAIHEADQNGNILVGSVMCLESKGNVVYSSGKLITLVDVENMVVVETPDAIMVCPKSKAQDVKKIVDVLRDEGKEDLL